MECHIGSGAKWFVKSKLAGTRQLVGVLTGDYSRPIETPIHKLRPAIDVCEVCHRAESFHGDQIKVIQQFEPDETNTRTYTVLTSAWAGAPQGGRVGCSTGSSVVRLESAGCTTGAVRVQEK